jgi:GntR family transcriptional regulator
MQIEIDPLSEIPLYQQLRDRIVEGIASGELAPGDSLAPVRQLAVEFGINVATVAKGYDLLRAEGLIRTNRTSGSVVARGPGEGADTSEWNGTASDGWSARLRTLLAEAVAQGVPDADIVAAVSAALDGFRVARSASARTADPRRTTSVRSAAQPAVPRSAVAARRPRGAGA